MLVGIFSENGHLEDQEGHWRIKNCINPRAHGQAAGVPVLQLCIPLLHFNIILPPSEFLGFITRFSCPPTPPVSFLV